MIPHFLERAIMAGNATYSKFTHAMGMYGNLEIAQGNLAIICDIKWTQFINPYKNDPAVSLTEFLKYNEYQLKVDGKKSINYLSYRNVISFQPNFGNFDLRGVTINSALAAIAYFNVGAPIIQDVYFICEESIKIVVSRNAFLNGFVSNYGLLDKSANQQNMPNGVQNLNVLKRLAMATAAPVAAMSYTPPGNLNAGLDNPGRNTETYRTDIQDLSQIYPPDTGFCATMNNPTLTQPLVEFGIVTINTNEFNRLANS